MTSPTPDLTPNDTDPLKTRIQKAKDWLIENPTENIATAARIFKINRKTLSNSINRGQLNTHHGGHNKILTQSQEEAIHKFIRSYLEHSQLPTRSIVFNAICLLRSHLNKPPPSQDWFTRWYKTTQLHKIKTKPIARVRISAQDEKEVEEWFKEYEAVLAKYRIRPRNIHNFDETGFRVGCPRGVEVIVPVEVKELYSLSPEDRKSLTIVEDICAKGTNPVPPVIIVQGKYHMKSWYSDGLKNKELVLISEKGFTNDELAIRFLEHFIQYTNSGPNKPYKLLLMDNLGAHRTPQFILLCRRNNIVPLTFPSHLTHVMQPLDVVIFQTYKHWHEKAVGHALETLDFDYNISSFFRDLHLIRQQTFSILTIKSAFRKAGMWPPSLKAIKKNMAKYSKATVKAEAKAEAKADSELLISQTPRNAHQIQLQLSELRPKIRDVLSSPSQRKFDSFDRGTVQYLDEAEITLVERDILYRRISEISKKKTLNRKRIQRGGELTGEMAQELLEKKQRDEVEKQKRKEERVLIRHVRDEERALKRLGIHRRRIERLRKKELEKVLLRDIGAAHLYIEIPDPETIAKREYESTQLGLQLSRQLEEAIQQQIEEERAQEMQEEVDIIINRREVDFQVEEDFIAFDESSSIDLSEGIIDGSSSSNEEDEEDHYLL